MDNEAFMNRSLIEPSQKSGVLTGICPIPQIRTGFFAYYIPSLHVVRRERVNVPSIAQVCCSIMTQDHGDLEG